MNLTEFAVKTVYWFFLYGFIGWGVEVVYAAVKTHKLVNRGFLCGPICPIYGFGMVGLIYSVSLIPMPDSGSMSAVAIFFIGMILTTAIELVGGWALFKIYHIRWWDYSNMKFNLGGYICPQFSLIWAAASAGYYYLVHPHILDALKWLSENLAFSFVIGFFFGVFTIDVVYSAHLLSRIRQFAKENEVDIKLERLKSHIRSRQDEQREKANFLFAFRSSHSLAEHLREAQEAWEERHKAEKK